MKKYMNTKVSKSIRFLAVLLLCTVFCPSYAADGDVFIFKTAEGVDMIFKVISEADKTCQVGDGDVMKSAIDGSTRGFITIPSKVNGFIVTAIGSWAFSYCSNITGVFIPSTVNVIDDYSIFNCDELKSITVDASNAKYDSRDNCNAIIRKEDDQLIVGCKATLIPSSVKSIGTYAFRGCPLTYIDIPSSVISIGENAFAFSGLRSITLPSSIKELHSQAFYYCYKIKDLFIPASVSYIGDAVFGDCDLETITVDADNSIYDSRELCNAVIETAKNALVTGCKNTSIPSTVVSIGNGAFYGSKNMVTMAIPSSVTTIERNAFYDCKDLKEICIPNSVVSIGNAAFMGCDQLTKFTIPSLVNSIGDYAFCICSNLKDVTSEIENPFDIGENVFSNISSDAVLTVPYASKSKYKAKGNWVKTFIDIVEKEPEQGYQDGDTFTANTIEGVEMTFKVISASNKTCMVGTGSYDNPPSAIDKNTIGVITIPSSIRGYKVTEISAHAFNSCKNVTDFIIPSTIEQIGDESFGHCESITEINIPKSVIYINNFAFHSCFNLGSITVDTDNPRYDSRNNCNAIISTSQNHLIIGCQNTLIPNTVQSIGKSSFYGHIYLKRIDIPSSVIDIETPCFQNCDNLESISVDSNNMIYDSRENCNGIVKTTTNELIVGCKTTYIPNSITAIGEYAFFLCRNLSKLTIPSKIKSIGNSAFTYCDQLSKVTSKIKNPFKITTSVFGGISKDAILYVPIGTKSLYESKGWSESFNNIVEVEDSYILTIKAAGNGSAIYNDYTIRDNTDYFTVVKGTSATVTFVPDNNCNIDIVLLNSEDVTSSVFNNQYIVSNINNDNTLEVKFAEDIIELTNKGVNYRVVSQKQQTVSVTGGNYGLTLTVPATFESNGKTWTVTGIENGAIADATGLAAIIWDPEVFFNATVSNPNLLLYVKDKKYAPTTIRNIVENGIAELITLHDAVNGNNFYCPIEFTATYISYTHNYSQQTGYNKCQGWETIALPFDVTTITNKKSAEIVPFAVWETDSNQKPFWLYTLTEEGWKPASTIKANTPYIISMPNNKNYDDDYNLGSKEVGKGDISFIGSNVQVQASEKLNIGTCAYKIFKPNFQYLLADDRIGVLNVVNLWESNTDGLIEGSVFVRNLRQVHPFEAYMTIEGNAGARRVIPIFEDGGSTGIPTVPVSIDRRSDAIYNLNGQRVNSMSHGIYIQNGKKIIKK